MKTVTADTAAYAYAALRWQVENEGCAASRRGETTYNCRADAPCGLCRLRAERDRLRVALHDVMGACDAECAGCGAYYVAKKAAVRGLFADAIGQWPGDETDEQIAEALRAIE